MIDGKIPWPTPPSCGNQPSTLKRRRLEGKHIRFIRIRKCGAEKANRPVTGAGT
jgi:hypothetical protein